MTLREITVAGVWVASAIEVAGFTYQAFTQTYQAFGAPGGGGGGGSTSQQIQTASHGAVNTLIQGATGESPNQPGQGGLFGQAANLGFKLWKAILP